MSEISPIPASQFKAEAQRGGGGGGGSSLTKILVIIGALVLLITVVIVLLWDPSVRPTHQFNEGCQLSILSSPLFLLFFASEHLRPPAAGQTSGDGHVGQPPL